MQTSRCLVYIIKLFYQRNWINIYSIHFFLTFTEYFHYLKRKKKSITNKLRGKVVAYCYVNLHCLMFKEVEYFYLKNQNLFFALEEAKP